ncbi:uncharacterized protein LOC133308787 isoform X2 [Gastrolobium bilobum]|uniref:uncharacterized protein LOC133308787 isoform X2 n=1 Tax=Gastrolobium bilobum TaxID=150636 RepID=UPI002AB1181D|nr:uncharacterized protein LOC133308787 isoform X2 [Gastrolobium bilobum]
MGKKNMESWEGTMPRPLPLLLRNVIASVLYNADNSFLLFAQKYKILQTLRFILLNCYLFFVRFLSSFILDKYDAVKVKQYHKYAYEAPRNDTGIARALSQLLSSLNDIPVSSRKYEVVRSLAERIIDDNQRDGVHALREINRVVLSAAFARALRQLEAAVAERGIGEGEGEGEYYPLRRVLRTVGWRVKGAEGNLSGVPAEKLAAELVWLAQKLAFCECTEEAVRLWAAASNLGYLSLTADPRLQSSLVKLAAFLFKEAKDMGLDEIEGSKMKLHMQVKLKMLQSWLPLLCRASNGTDAPALSISEKAELERVLENIIEGLEQEEQEQILSLWLHHFTHCSSSDWPNLHACFARWCTVSRKQLLHG